MIRWRKVKPMTMFGTICAIALTIASLYEKNVLGFMGWCVASIMFVSCMFDDMQEVKRGK